MKILQLTLTALAVLAIVVFAAGCGGDETTSTAEEPPPASPADPGTEPAEPDGAGVTAEVSAVANTFDPAEITIAAGESVRWTNNDPVAHDVTSDAAGIAAMIPEEGSEFVHTFSDPGSFAYTCTLHPGMDGTVIVE